MAEYNDWAGWGQPLPVRPPKPVRIVVNDTETYGELYEWRRSPRGDYYAYGTWGRWLPNKCIRTREKRGHDSTGARQ